MSYIRKHPRLSKHLKGNSVPLGKAVRLIKTVDLPFTRGGGVSSNVKAYKVFLFIIIHHGAVGGPTDGQTDGLPGASFGLVWTGLFHVSLKWFLKQLALPKSRKSMQRRTIAWRKL